MQAINRQNEKSLENSEMNILQSEILKLLTRNGPMIRSQMVIALETPRTTIYDNLSVLIRRKVVKKFSRQVNSRGRPLVFFKLAEE